ncbi:MAG: PQQ-dependent sugar dehydrogenase [Burkholderiaceae bacterium]
MKVFVRLLTIAVLISIGGLLALTLIATGHGDGIVRRLQYRLNDVNRQIGQAGWTPLASALHPLEWRALRLSDEARTGGALTYQTAVGVVAASAQGEFYRLADNDSPEKLAIPSPLNFGDLEAHPLSRLATFHREYFRINDILLVPSLADDGGFDLYATHHYFDAEHGCVQWRLSRIPIALDKAALVAKAAGWQSLVIARPCVEIATSKNPIYYAFNGDVSGGRMLLWDRATLMVTSGELQMYEKSGLALSQDPQSDLGKILLIDRATGAVTPYARGLRNPQGLWRDRRGRVWETEHGPRGGDELNLIERGGDYGWPSATYGTHYDLRAWRADGIEGVHASGSPPRLAFVPSLGISVVIELDPRQFPNWAGDLLIGSLSSQKLIRVRLDGDHPVYTEVISMPGFRIRDLDVLPDGSIVALSNRLEVLFIRNASGAGSHALTGAAMAAVNMDTVLAALPAERAELVRLGADAYRANCIKCHGSGGAVAAAPNLRGVIGREIGSASGYAYSPGLMRAGGSWSEASLIEFLADPDTFAPGQAMPAPELQADTRRAIAAYLAEAMGAADR